MWWVGQAIGVVTLGSGIFAFVGYKGRRSPWRLIRACAASLPASAAIAIVYYGFLFREFRYVATSLLLIPTLAVGPLGAAAGSTLLAVSAVFTVALNPETTHLHIATLQIFLIITTLVMLMVAAVVAQRDRSEELRRSQEQFHTISEASPDLLYMHDPQGRVTYANPQMLQFFGLGLESLSNHGWLHAVHPDDLHGLEALLEQAHLRVEAVDTDLRVRNVHAREYRWFHYRALPLSVEHGKPRIWHGQFTDIHDKATEAARLEELVERQTAGLRQSNEDLERFSYSVSHDLRSPLRSIVASARILKEEQAARLPPDAINLLDRQANAALRMAQLIDDLLEFSRLGRSEVARQNVDVSQVARTVVQELGVDPHKSEIEIESNLRANADPRFVAVVLQNLIENALKYGKPDERAHVRVGFDQAKGAFYVRDNGNGFDPVYHERIFEPFERLQPDDKIEGTGIGLANVRQSIQRHGGRVWAESAVGEGATFYFTLPAARTRSA
jgi:PAS domain S-box-containing protein